MWSEPSGLWGYVRDDTPSIGSVTGVIMPWSTLSCRIFSMALLHSVGTFLLACCTVGKVGSRQMVYISGMLPVVSNDLGGCFFKGNYVLGHLLQKYWKNGLVMKFFGKEWSWKGLLWPCNDITLSTLWSWNVLFWCCFHFRTDFSFGFWVGAFLVAVLECKGILNETCLTFELSVMESTTAWELASLGTLNSTIPKWMDAG